MTEASVSFAGNLTDDPEVRYTEGGIARAMFRVAVSGRKEQEASFFTEVLWRDQAEHASQSLAKGSRVVVMGRLQRRSWTAEDGSARSVVEVVRDHLGGVRPPPGGSDLPLTRSKTHRKLPGTGRRAALVAGASFSRHTQGGGIWPDGAGMPDPAASAPPTNPAPEPTTGRRSDPVGPTSLAPPLAPRCSLGMPRCPPSPVPRAG